MEGLIDMGLICRSILETPSKVHIRFITKDNGSSSSNIHSLHANRYPLRFPPSHHA